MAPSPSSEHPEGPGAPPGAPDRGRLLLAIARAAIEQALGRRGSAAVPGDDAAWLRRPGATFVTLEERGELRGCIGSLRAHRPLGDDVRDNALAAAFRDPRFPPLAASELPGLAVEVSLLSELEPLEVRDEAQLVAVLRPGLDGLMIDLDGYRATFLPQVWDDLPTPRAFLDALWQKAGLPPRLWRPTIRIWRYGVTKWTE